MYNTETAKELAKSYHGHLEILVIMKRLYTERKLESFSYTELEEPQAHMQKVVVRTVGAAEMDLNHLRKMQRINGQSEIFLQKNTVNFLENQKSRRHTYDNNFTETK